MKSIKFRLSLLFLLLTTKSFSSESKCSKTCDLALASYYILGAINLTYISDIMQSKVVSKREDIFSYSNGTLQNPDVLQVDSRVNVPFPCDCINDEFLGHTFLYKAQHGDDYASIAEVIFSNLTTEDWMERVNFYSSSNIPKNGTLNVTVNCSCGNREVSKDYGLFITYPLRSEDTLESIAKDIEPCSFVIAQEVDPMEGLSKLVDPRLGDNYSIDSINKMAQLAKACTNRDPKQRPRMGDVVVSLMKLNSTIDDGSRIDSAA